MASRNHVDIALMRAVRGLRGAIESIPAFFTKERTTLHDLAAKTRVVNVNRS